MHDVLPRRTAAVLDVDVVVELAEVVVLAAAALRVFAAILWVVDVRNGLARFAGDAASDAPGSLASARRPAIAEVLCPGPEA